MRHQILAALLAGTCMLAPARAQQVDKTQLEQIEDYTESLANQLHDLSLALRARNLEKLAGHFSPHLEAAGLPAAGEGLSQELKWIYQRDLGPIPENLDRARFIATWDAFLKRLSSIEDVRFKVKQATYPHPGHADASIYFFVIARDAQQRREWVEGRAHLRAALQPDSTWQIDHFEVYQFTDRVTKAELFSEVTLPAGVYQAVPPFGTPGNQRFTARGVAVCDVDRDGLVDIFTIGLAENFLYLNQGDGAFENCATQAGLQITPQATAPLFLDSDGDGDQDLFLSAQGEQMFFENRLVPEGQLNFVDLSQQAGVSVPAQGYSAVAGDVNLDGRPDIYVASYNQYGLVMPNSWHQATNGTPNLLFINQGGNHFAEQAAQWGVADSRWSYAAQLADLSGDGRPDLFLANDFGEKAFYLNEGDHFRDVAAERGMLDPGNGMGVSLADFDNDGDLDLHITNMSSTAGSRIVKRLFPDAATQRQDTRVLNKLAAGNTLFRNLGGGNFEDVSAALGPFPANWAWGGGFVDLDNDGWEDLHTPNGFITGKSLKDT